MIDGVNIEEVKKYNAALKDYQNKAASAKAAIEYNTNELNKLCAELSAELGVQVTVENIEQIRDEYIKNVQNTLNVGNEILERIRQEEQLAGHTVAATPVAAATPSPASVVPNIPVAPEAPATPTTPAAPGIDFNALGNIPSIFAQN